MNGRRVVSASDDELAGLIRSSRVLDPVLKRQWLRVLPHLRSADRTRLRNVLLDGDRGPDLKSALPER